MAYAEANYNIQVCTGFVEQTRLQYRVAHRCTYLLAFRRNPDR